MYSIYALKCNDMRNPNGITDENPKLSWKLYSDENQIRQKAYRIKVWNEENECIWDSKKIESDILVDVRCIGLTLQSNNTYLWQVISINNKGQEAVSEIVSFSTGFMTPDAWKGKWIEANYERKPLTDCIDIWEIFSEPIARSEHPEKFLNPVIYFRKEFIIHRKIKKAIMYATARGIYDLQIDGTSISEILAPGYTPYSKYLEIQRYDVTDLITFGSHAIGVGLADGWFTGKIGLLGIGNQYGDTNAFYMQMEIAYTDGSRETIVSDEDFKWNTGAYEYADLFIGECYNTGKELLGWNQHSYENEKEAGWNPVLIKDYGTKNFKGREAAPVKIIRTIKDVQFLTTPTGELVLDTGENIAGYLKLTFYGTSGQTVVLKHSEVLDKDGNFMMNVIGQNKNQMDMIICTEDKEYTYETKFSFHGFRYVKLENLNKEDIIDISVQVLGTDMDVTGNFSCSNPKINQLQKNILRSQQGNMISIPTDCPQRERAGWTGDMQIYATTACYNMDVKAFLERWLGYMRMEQLSDGQIPKVIPTINSNNYLLNSDSIHICSAGWGDACIIVPFALYNAYGDNNILEKNFKMMEKWINYVERQASTTFPKPIEEYAEDARGRQQYLWNTEFHFGDWLFPSASANGSENQTQSALLTKDYVATAMYAYTTYLMSKICEILNKKDAATYYFQLNSEILKAFDEEYVDSQGNLTLDLQGIYVLALRMDLISEDKKESAVNNLLQLIHKNEDCLDTGFISVPFLLDVLYDAGQKEVAYKLLYQTKCPSWLYEIDNGATTIWEAWNVIQPDGIRTKLSHNHFAFGCVGDFIYRKILGLNIIEGGCKKVLIAPDLDCGLEHAEGTFDSVYGKISISWEKQKSHAQLIVMLPPNVSANIIFGNIEKLVESGYYEFNY